MLVSVRFAGDPVLQACLDGTHRMLAPETGEAVRKVQQALLDLGFQLPVFGADGAYGDETAAAVTEFKIAKEIEPSDGVVGPKTMAALDALFADEPGPVVPPTPPPPPPPVVDPTTRRPAGAAKVPAALATVAAFRANPAGTNWLHLDRATVADGIAGLVADPDGSQQGGNGLCTTAAFINLWAQDAPDAFAAFATALFDNGAADLAPFQGGGGLRIAPSQALLAADHQAIATRMAASGFAVPPQAHWMVMSAIRDSSNSIFKFTGDPDDWVSHNLGDGASPLGDLETWMRAAGAWLAVVNEESAILGTDLSQALALDVARTRCILTIDVSMIRPASSGRHSVVLRAPVTEAADGSIDFKVWTFARVEPVHVTRQVFDSTYFGSCNGFF